MLNRRSIQSMPTKTLTEKRREKLIKQAVMQQLKSASGPLPDEMDLHIELSETDEHFAAKLHTGILSDASDQARLEQEISKLKSLGEFVLYDSNFTEDYDLLVTHAFFGQSLSKLKNADLTVADFFTISMSICHEAQRLLNAGYLHCDLRPRNILINLARGEARFGEIVNCRPTTPRFSNQDIPWQYQRPREHVVTSDELIVSGKKFSPYADLSILENACELRYLYSEKRSLIYSLGLMMGELLKLTRRIIVENHATYQLLLPVHPAHAKTDDEDILRKLHVLLGHMTNKIYSQRPTVGEALSELSSLQKRATPSLKATLITTLSDNQSLSIHGTLFSNSSKQYKFFRDHLTMSCPLTLEATETELNVTPPSYTEKTI